MTRPAGLDRQRRATRRSQKRHQESSNMIHVVAVLTAKPGQRDEVLKHFRANIPAVLAEKGCIEYAPAVDADPALPIQAKYGPDAFVVIEKWEDMDALEAHAAAPHMIAFGEKVKDVLASRTIHILSPT
jgi:quinol monooxygenase YgiN